MTDDRIEAILILRQTAMTVGRVDIAGWIRDVCTPELKTPYFKWLREVINDERYRQEDDPEMLEKAKKLAKYAKETFFNG